MASGNYVVHAQLEIGSEYIMFNDVPSDNPPVSNMAILVEFDSADAAKTGFDALKEGGGVLMELRESLRSKSLVP